ncbi:hypothetical protein RFI_32326 [Reticulomyxa filosa]|uniref:EF-hand domain-containing protein n=1 Tax=Reticulomyxa filosa TaxID=46433 RepID=X6LWG7_RETFI|nr:hypothetical protein RFI_32326 [Reticulomyxa filosa]|eukprot:ETO05070.1 hypothetical protein RFI_32326 [Reticulomyxa filosa]
MAEQESNTTIPQSIADINDTEHLLEKLRIMFEEADANHDKVLDLKEFEKLMKEWMPESTPQQLQKLFDAFDVDKSGAIKYTELLESDFFTQFLLAQSAEHHNNEGVAGEEVEHSQDGGDAAWQEEQEYNELKSQEMMTRKVVSIFIYACSFNEKRECVLSDMKSNFNNYFLKNQEIQQLKQWIEDFGKPAERQCDEYRRENAKLLDEKRKLEMELEQSKQEMESLSAENNELTKWVEKLQTSDKEKTDNLTRLTSDAVFL